MVSRARDILAERKQRQREVQEGVMLSWLSPGQVRNAALNDQQQVGLIATHKQRGMVLARQVLAEEHVHSLPTRA